jgi:glycosyltransferase involved in cell wall biosynthesis
MDRSTKKKVRYKVLFLCPSLVGAGVERRVCTLLNHFESGRYAVSLGLLRLEGEFLNEVGSARIHYVEPPLAWLKRLLSPLPCLPTVFNFIAAVYQQRRIVVRVQPDIVVTFTLETTLPLSLISATLKERNIRWVISEDSNTAEATLHQCQNRWLAAPALAVLGRAYRKADAVTAVSTAVGNSLQTHYRIPAHAIAVIANPIDSDRIRRTGRKEQLTDLDVPFVLSVGRLVKVKRFDLLLRAFAEVRRRRSIDLVMLGEGPERQTLQRLAARLGIAGGVILPGFVANPWVYMQQARVFVLTSRTEGFGNVLVEAMTGGCPVISTDSGGPGDIIVHNKNGIIAAANPHAIAVAMLELLDDEAKRQRLIRAAASDLSRYRPERICEQFCRLFDEVLDRS